MVSTLLYFYLDGQFFHVKSGWKILNSKQMNIFLLICTKQPWRAWFLGNHWQRVPDRIPRPSCAKLLCGNGLTAADFVLSSLQLSLVRSLPWEKHAVVVWIALAATSLLPSLYRDQSYLVILYQDPVYMCDVCTGTGQRTPCAPCCDFLPYFLWDRLPLSLALVVSQPQHCLAPSSAVLRLGPASYMLGMAVCTQAFLLAEQVLLATEAFPGPTLIFKSDLLSFNWHRVHFHPSYCIFLSFDSPIM